MGEATRTSANFFNQPDPKANPMFNPPSSNNLFGGDSTSQPVPIKARGTNVVADNNDDDWDNEEVNS